MNNETIIKALKVLFPKEITINDVTDIYKVSVAQYFHWKYGIIVGYDYLPNVKIFYPHCRTNAYTPKNSMIYPKYGDHMFKMSNSLKYHKGTINECYLRSIIIAICYIAIKLKPELTINYETFEDYTPINIAIELDKFDNPIELKKVVNNIIKLVNKEEFELAFKNQ